MWHDLSSDISDMFSLLEGCLDRTDSAGLSYRKIVEEDPERVAYKAAWAKRQLEPARAAKRDKKERALALIASGVPKAAVARELGVNRATIARWAA